VSEVPCRCAENENDGRLCDPCAAREFQRLHAMCQRDPECRDACSCQGDGSCCDYCIRSSETPRPEGRERVIGSFAARGGPRKRRSTEDDDVAHWKTISERLSRIENDEDALDKMARNILQHESE